MNLVVKQQGNGVGGVGWRGGRGRWGVKGGGGGEEGERKNDKHYDCHLESCFGEVDDERLKIPSAMLS